MVSMERLSTALLAGEMKFGKRPSRSLSNVPPSDTGKWEREISAVERSHKQLMGPCVSGSQPFSRAWTLYLSENLEKSNQEMRPP